ncbi:MAG: protein kinase [Alphaproteobacteria bacterium]|nr:protein kinase [Alphaproteobacteria bacterium]
MELRPQATIGPYVVVRVAGRGGMAVVYQVRHRHLGTDHALKRLLHAESSAARLRQEARTQASLVHRNVVRLVEVLDFDGEPALVLEYVAGPTLAEFLGARRLTLEQVDDLARGVLAGVAAAHRADLVHRDLKPANVLLDPVPDGIVPKVADFGLAKALAGDDPTLTRTGAVMGTPAYMAPEQVTNTKAADARSDVYALGVMLFEIVSGTRPEDVTSLDLPGDLPSRMTSTIRRALCAEPADRFADAEEMLAAWVDGVAPPEGVWAGVDFDMRPTSSAEPSGETWSDASVTPASIDPPSGVVTLVAVLPSDDAASPQVLSEVDRALRGLAPSHGAFEGQWVDRGHLFAFADPRAATRFALEASRLVPSTATWSDESNSQLPRIGLHTGTPELRVDPRTRRMSYVGEALELVLTLARTSVSGQVLSSADAHRAAWSDAVHWSELGGFFLPGSDRVHTLFQVSADASPPRSPRAISTACTNLPTRPEPFEGRAQELELVRVALTRGRGAAIVGLGGAGKTRLAARFAATNLGCWPGGAWVVELGEARSSDGILFAVASALEVPLGTDPVRQLGYALHSRGPTLLVFDTVERLLTPLAELLDTWWALAPSLVVIVTSRAEPAIPGLTPVEIGPLPEADGVALFLERAKLVVPTPPDPDEVRALVAEIDTLPLAIELLAARLRALPIREIRARVSHRLKLLAGGSGLQARHQSLRAALDGSFEALDESARESIGQASVFSGGFSLAAAEAVIEVGDEWVVDAIQQAMTFQLIKRAGDRYRMLDVVREYAGGTITSADRIAAEMRHGDHFSAFGVEESLDHMACGAAGREVAADLDNLVVAADRALTAGRGVVAARAALAATEVLKVTGPFRAAAKLLDRVGAVAPGRERLSVGIARARVGVLAGETDSVRELLGRVVDDARSQGHTRALGRGLSSLADLHRLQGDPATAFRLGEEAMAVHAECGDRFGAAMTEANLAIVAHETGRLQEAHDRYERALERLAAEGHVAGRAQVLANRANLWSRAGSLEEAYGACLEALAAHREVGNRTGEAVALANAAGLAHDLGRFEAARIHADDGLALARSLGARRLEGFVLGNLANLNAATGRTEDAVRCFALAVALQRETGEPKLEAFARLNLGLFHLSQGADEAAEAEVRTALGAARELGMPFLEGVAYRALADVLITRGEPAAARDDARRAVQMLRPFDPRELARAFFRVVRAEHGAGDVTAAAAALGEAQDIVASLPCGSDLDDELASVRDLLTSAT